MDKTLLITRPEHDLTTRYISKWSEKILEVANQKRFEIIELKKEKVTKENVLGRLKKKASIKILVIFNGHGNEDTITGQEYEPLVTSNTAAILKSKIVYARSCRSACNLGRAAVMAGCVAYIGYKEDFIFLYDKEKISKPLEDKKAAIFLEPSNYVATSLIKGHSASDSNERSKNLFRKRVEQLVSAKQTLENQAALRFMVVDMVSQVCLGDGVATI